MVQKDKDRKKDIGEHLYSSRKSVDSSTKQGLKNYKTNKSHIAANDAINENEDAQDYMLVGDRPSDKSKVNEKSNRILYKKMQAEVHELLPQDSSEPINQKLAIDILEIMGYFFKLPD